MQQQVRKWMVPVPPREAGPAGAGLDRDEARRALAVLADPDSLLNVRCITPGRQDARNLILPAKDVDGVLAEAERWAATGRNIYVTLNPIKEDTKRPPNGGPLKENISRYRWLFLDIDPDRAPGFEKASATDQEKTCALALTDRVAAHLASIAWPAPVRVDSGNGFYLLYRVDLPPSAQPLISRVLNLLGDTFDGEGAAMDRAVHDPPRIAKLPGTVARKGVNTPDRPHRPCRLLDVPEPVEPVTEDRLWDLVGVQSDDPAPAAPEPSRNGRHGGGFRVPIPESGPSAEARAVAYLATCEPAIDGKGGSRVTFRVARAVVYGFDLGPEVGFRLMMEHYNPRCQGPWSESEMRHKCVDAHTKPYGKDRGWLLKEAAPNYRQTSWAPEEEDRSGNGGERKRKHKWSFVLDNQILAEGDPGELVMDNAEIDDAGDTIRIFEMNTIGVLLRKDFPPPNWIIPGIMSEGLNILAGAPKQGKSMLSLNLALTVAGGGKAMGNIEIPPSDVLYLSLEDKQRRVKGRAVKMMQAVDPSLAGSIYRRLTVVTDWPKQDEGGLAMLNLWVKKAEKPGLVIIDVWNRFAPAQKNTGSTYSHDADAMGEVKRFVERHGFTALIVHHTRKPGLKEPGDYVNEISGTLGLSGTADGILVLVRHRQDRQAQLHVTGRDVVEQELVLEFDPNTLTWHSLGTNEDHLKGQVQKAIIAYLKSLAGASAFAADIATAISQKEDSVRKALGRMRVDRIVRKVGSAWAYPGEAELDPDAEVPL